MLTILIVAWAIVMLILLLLYITTKRELTLLKHMHEELMHDHRSVMVKHGMSFEQLFPYMKNYPYNPRNFRFIGDPIDGVSFEEDHLAFIEFKTGKASLSEKQKRVKELIHKKKVEWREIRE